MDYRAVVTVGGYVPLERVVRASPDALINTSTEANRGQAPQTFISVDRMKQGLDSLLSDWMDQREISSSEISFRFDT